MPVSIPQPPSACTTLYPYARLPVLPGLFLSVLSHHGECFRAPVILQESCQHHGVSAKRMATDGGRATRNFGSTSEHREPCLRHLRSVSQPVPQQLRKVIHQLVFFTCDTEQDEP
ncbi:hypothetical protein O3P69_012962 [Scylla paramamosain]|uniref:Uncharacterized protein n=1 Tax=Scylla paramamosain TaxID=85552 RepID=A0AAW0TRH9_SCYPA